MKVSFSHLGVGAKGYVDRTLLYLSKQELISLIIKLYERRLAKNSREGVAIYMAKEA